MLDTETKHRIDTARDILVGKVPDPKSQVEQITIALIYKFMDDMDAEAEELGGKRKFFTRDFARYGWAKLMRSGLGGHETLALYAEGITKMTENPNLPPLFRDIFKNAYLPYRDPETRTHIAPQAHNVSNRRWSASAASAEPADRATSYSSALQGLNVADSSALAGLGDRWRRHPPVPLAALASPTVIHIPLLRSEAPNYIVLLRASVTFTSCPSGAAPQARNVNNRRWSASAASAEPADSATPYSSALQGLNVDSSSAPAGLGDSGIRTPPVALAGSLHRRLLTLRSCGAMSHLAPCLSGAAPQARNVSNRRWSASAASAEPAEQDTPHSSALQGLNVADSSALAGLGDGVDAVIRRFRSLRSLHRRLFISRSCGAMPPPL